MNNFVVSKPAEDLRARWRVLMTSPEGRTTVYIDNELTRILIKKINAYCIEEPFALCSTITDRIRCRDQDVNICPTGL